MSRPLVFFLNPVRFAHDTYRSLSELAKLHTATCTSRSAFFQELQSSANDAVAIFRTSAAASLVGRFDEELIKRLPDSVKLICHVGAGYDQIDVSSCSARGILVTSTPTAVTAATADLAIFLIIGALRNFGPSILTLRQGKFKAGIACGHDPSSKTLGILGMGRIGKAVVKRADALGFKRIVYHTRTPPTIGRHFGVRADFVDTLDELLSLSDVLSVHVPYHTQTHHLLGPSELAKLKAGAIIINTARGQLIDETGLVSALEAGHLAGAGLDVYEDEPNIHPGLLKSSKTLLLPHMGTHSVETLMTMEEAGMQELAKFLRGEKLSSVVPEQADMENIAAVSKMNRSA